MSSYDDYPSYSPPAPAPDDSGGSYNTSDNYTPPTSNSSSTRVAVGICVAVVFIVAFICIIVFCICRRKKRRKHDQLASNTASSIQITPSAPVSHDYEAAVYSASPLSGAVQASKGGSGSNEGNRSFSYEQLSVATKHFNDSELLCRGGSGAVYRGRLPEDGTLVAVKCIPDSSNQGVKEFNAEVSIISELRHRNLVKLKGWCQDEGRFVLVYDYMPNGSLDSLLHSDALCVKLHWERRYEIAMGLGAALLYLHEECERVIIHRNVKSSNVLLDENFTAKLGDFKLSRQVDLGVTSHMTTSVVAGTRGHMAPECFAGSGNSTRETDVYFTAQLGPDFGLSRAQVDLGATSYMTTSVVAETRGYMAPECFVGSGKSTRETDVYAFGAVLLELVTGKLPLDGSLREFDGVLVDWVWHLYGQERVLQALDQRLGGNWEREEARRLLVVGLACSHPDPQGRPKIQCALKALDGTVGLPHLPASKPTVGLGHPHQ